MIDRRHEFPADSLTDKLLSILVLGGGSFFGWIVVFLTASALMSPAK